MEWVTEAADKMLDLKQLLLNRRMCFPIKGGIYLYLVRKHNLALRDATLLDHCAYL